MQEICKIHYPAGLPVAEQRREIIQALKKNRVLIIAGETGSGKTTQLPKMCLEAGRGRKKMIGCTQPRRIAAISVAARVAEELNSAPGGLVGSKVRFSDKTGASTKIKFLTDGMLLAESQQDRQLNAYDTIIIDEAHERGLNIDFLLGMLKGLLEKRKDLKVIISSATMDTEKFSAHFGGAPVLTVEGRSYPVEVISLTQEEERQREELGHVELAVRKVREVAQHGKPGDLLVFMPTERDILEVVEGLTKDEDLDILPLFGRMSGPEQARIFKSSKRRKVVVATNVAETSITVPGIRYVIDSGLVRLSSYSARARTTKLPVRPISKASAEQRKGRCGRVGPGVCYRLYSQEDFEGRPEHTPPEIVRSNLAEVILRMLHLRLGHPSRFPFIDPPLLRSVKDGFSLLRELGAIRHNGGKGRGLEGLSKRGRFMAKLPVDPTISRMIIEAGRLHCLTEILVIAAALTIQDPRIRPLEREKEADRAHARFTVSGSDFLTFLKIWEVFWQEASTRSRSSLRRFCRTTFLSYQRMREWGDIHEQLSRIAADHKGFSLNRRPATPKAVHQAILSGVLRNIGLKKEKNLYQGGQGREMMIFPGSGLFSKGGEWIMAAEIIETSRRFARMAAIIDPGWLEPLAGPLCRSTFGDPHWEKRRGQVVALEKVTLFGLLIVAGRKRDYGALEPDEARMIFLQSALLEGQVNKTYPFLTQNLQLAEELREVEERVRSRALVVDDEQLLNFYDQRLPPEVRDIKSLERVLGRLGDTLLMREEDILRSQPDQDRLALFPDFLTIGEMQLKLSYRFEPGDQEDGVTALVPMDLLPHLDPEVFDWLVPGLIQDKILHLLKGLPKKIRRSLVPLPETAKEVCEQLDFGKGSLFTALETVLEKQYQQRVERPMWRTQELPGHLVMRCCVLDSRNRGVRVSRSFADLLEHRPASAMEGRLQKLKEKYERQGICHWDFSGLPDRIPVQGRERQLNGFVFPGLTANANTGVDLRLFQGEEEARAATRQGVLALYKLQLGKRIKDAGKVFSLAGHEWPLFEGFGSQKQFNQLLQDAILTELCKAGCGRIPSRQEFEERLAHLGGDGLLKEGRPLFERIVEILQERRATIETISRFESKSAKGAVHKERFSLFREQLTRLVPSSFFENLQHLPLQHLPRFLKGLRLRVERAHANPEADSKKNQKLVLSEQRITKLPAMLDRIRTAPKREQAAVIIAEYRFMVEEFKVSLFAQELKTSLPVSEKRLEKKWREIEQSL